MIIDHTVIIQKAIKNIFHFQNQKGQIDKFEFGNKYEQQELVNFGN